MLKISRRALLGALAAAPFVPAIVAAAVPDPHREPYVLKDEWVTSIVWHVWEKPVAAPSVGDLLVHDILPWDGKGYPIVLAECGWKVEDRILYHGHYDFEWSNLRRDVPENFWHNPDRTWRYPNVHSYVREQRFGESPMVTAAYMKRNTETDGIYDMTPEEKQAALIPYFEWYKLQPRDDKWRYPT